MTVIDAHHHFWRHGLRPHQWPPAAGDVLNRDFMPDDLLPELRRAGIEGTVLVQSLNDLQETEEYLDLARETPWVRGVVGWVPLDNPAETEVALESLVERGPLIGLRHLMRVEAKPDWIVQYEVIQSLALIARAGLVFELVPINPAQFENALTIAARLPQLQLVLDHLGRPPVPEQGWEPWATLIKRTADAPNVAVKLSAGMDLVLRWRWSTDMLRRYVDHVVQCFGAGRIMAASNWPVVLLAGDYEEVWGGITALVSELSERERQEILGDTAMRVYGLAAE